MAETRPPRPGHGTAAALVATVPAALLVLVVLLMTGAPAAAATIVPQTFGGNGSSPWPPPPCINNTDPDCSLVRHSHEYCRQTAEGAWVAYDGCAFVRSQCANASDSRYTTFVFCAMSGSEPVACVLLLAWLLLLLSVLATTADFFFVPPLTMLSDRLGLSPAVAGITLLALGNGAPDVFTVYASIVKAGDFSLGLGSLLGSSISSPRPSWAWSFWSRASGPRSAAATFSATSSPTSSLRAWWSASPSAAGSRCSRRPCSWPSTPATLPQWSSSPASASGDAQSSRLCSPAPLASAAAHSLNGPARSSSVSTTSTTTTYGSVQEAGGSRADVVGNKKKATDAGRSGKEKKVEEGDEADDENIRRALLGLADDEEEEDDMFACLLGLELDSEFPCLTWPEDASLLARLQFVLEFPFSVLRWLSIPSADGVWGPRHRWAAILSPTGLISVLVLAIWGWEGFEYQLGSLPAYALVAIVGIALSVAIWATSSPLPSRLPPYYILFCIAAFAGSIAWLNLAVSVAGKGELRIENWNCQLMPFGLLFHSRSYNFLFFLALCRPRKWLGL